MAPTRTNPSIRAARTSTGPLEQPPPLHPHTRGEYDAPTIMTVDGIAHGWQYKHLYAKSGTSEFHRPPGPGVTKPVDPRPPPLTLKDLECIRTLGQGEYGKVVLVRTRRTTYPLDKPGSLFAMKVLRKKFLRIEEQQNPHKKNVELGILAELPWNPFVNGVLQTFYDTRNLYLMLELIPSGTLRSAIQKRGPLDAATAAFYYANIVCGLSFLEDHDIVHRDLKPDNILIGPEGYLCLADFGCAAIEDEESNWLMVGTPCYMAPELISPEGQTYGYGKPIDWWASGCILFEMLTRRMPFFGDSEPATYKKVLAVDYKWPQGMRVGKSLKSLVSGLLTADAAKRLGTQKGATEVSKHPWFREVDWAKMQTRQYLAPHVPRTPNLTATWHSEPLPEQRKVPRLRVVKPPMQLAYDDRFPTKPVV